MDRYFPIFHGLHEHAPWGIAIERESGTPRVELVLLCRTEAEAKEHAERTSLGQAMKNSRDGEIAEAEPARAGEENT